MSERRTPVPVENLLRKARIECGGRVAFATTMMNGDGPRTVAVPPAGTPQALSVEAVAELSRQARADPEFLSGRVLVRTVRMGEPLALAVAAVPGTGTGGVLGVVGDEGTQFAPAQLDMLSHLAARLGRHLAAVQALHGTQTRSGDAGAPARPNGRTDVREASDPDALLSHTPLVPTPPAPATPAPATPTPLTTHEPPRPAPTPVAPGAVTAPRGPSGSPAPPEPAASPHWPDAGPDRWWAESDPLTGLPSLGQFFSRAGRLLASETRATGTLALVLVEVPDERTAPAAADALRAQLRFTDPVARVDRDLFAAAVLLFPGSVRGDAVEERLGAAVRSALDWLSPVRTTHVLAEPGDRRDVDELLRQAIVSLPGRSAGNGGAPWRGAGGSAARLPIP